MENSVLTKKGTKESILNAYVLLAHESSSLCKKVMKDDSFVINIQNFGLIIDQKEKLTFNPLEYNLHASKLYDLFNNIPDETWHNC